jgi:gliding motility-associated-like protein
MKKQLLLSILFSLCSFFLYSQTYIMGTNIGTQSTCSGNFYDSGGSAGSYGNSQNQVITFCPATAGQAIQVSFSSFASESGFDYLYVFNGNSTAASQVGAYTGTVAVGAITSSNATGCLTFSWHTDGSVVANGWSATVSCVNPPPPTLGPASSCGAVTTNNSLCTGSTSFNLGSASTPMPTTSCLGTTYGVGWYLLQAQNTNPIQITLTSGSDVDFALWGPFMTPPPYNCSALGATVDCSFSASSTEYVDILSPITGAYYLLAVSNYGGTTGNINLNVTAGTIPCAASPTCNISNLTATPSACNGTNNTYSVSGTATFTTPPASGTLTISSNCGGSQTFNAPFTSPLPYNLTGLTSNGASCTVTASFSATSCSRTQTYTASGACFPCNTTASNSGTICAGGNVNLSTTAVTNATSYNWAGPSGFSASGQNVSANNLAASGTYTVTVTTSAGCTSTSTTVVQVNPAPTVSITPTSVLCNGGNTGSAVATASGGTAGYTYSWSPVSGSTTNLSNLTAGIYTCFVRDANNCTASASGLVNQPTAISANATANPASCNGGLNGSATINASGGTPGYTYAWSSFPAQTTQTATNLGFGAYTCVITDANNCTAAANITVSQPTLLSSSATNTPISCNGGTSTVTVSATGGTLPYTGTGNFTVNAGVNNFTVTDGNGCTSTSSLNISQPTALVASSSNTPILCNGGTSTVTISATGGTAPYTGTGTFTVNAGTYSYTVTDANGCISTTSITITEPTTFAASSSNTPILCNGGTSTVTVSGSGGTLPYTGTGNFTVNAGSYTYNISDANGCAANTSITVIEPTLLVASSSATTILCNGGTADIAVSAIGGTTPYTGTGIFTVSAGTYSYTVTDANGCSSTTSITITEPTLLQASNTNTPILCNGGNSMVTVSGSGGTLPYTGTGNFTEVAGNYTYTITDANGCSATTSLTITEPTLFTSASSATAILCSGGNSTVTVSGNGGTLPYTGTGNFTEVAGNYTYTITDANGCTSTTSISISEPTLLQASSTATAIACNGGTADITVSATGGTAPYTGTGTFTVNAGNYTYTVTDANGCTANTSINVGQAATLTISLSANPILCNGGSTTVNVVGGGGTLPYTGTGSFTVNAGTYNYTITDANGCAATDVITVNEPTLLTSSSSATAILCFGNTSTVTVAANGGTLPYTGTGNFTEVAGSYTYNITDANGCATSTSITISEPTLLTISASNTAILCNGNTSDVTISGAGGTLPYTGTGTFTVNAGNYTYTITDANACSATTSLNIAEPTLLVGSSTNTPILCNGGTTDITVAATGGTAPYNGTGTFTVNAGSYTYNISDANGCATSTSITVSEPTLLAAASSATQILCFGGTADITVSATGGTAPYNGTGTFTVTAGTYTYTVTDANGCTSITSITITEPTLLTIGASNTAILCNGGTSDVTVSGAGGTLPYTGTGTFTVNAGTYTYTVTDANGCTASTSLTITEPTLLVGSSTNTPILCNGGTSDITVSATGGTTPYTGTGTFTVNAGSYTYNISDANGCATSTSIAVSEPTLLVAASSATQILCFGGTADITVSATGGTSPYNGTGTFTVTAGTYSYTVTDANGCSSITSITISEPTLLNIGAGNTQILCNGGTSSVTISASGGTPNYTGTGTFSVPAGSYTYNISDANGCTSSTSFTITEPTLLTSASSATAILCFGGTADITVSANGGTLPYTGTGTFTVNAGTYTYNITDANGCATTTSIVVSEPTLLVGNATASNISCNGGTATVSVSATGGTPAYTGTGIFTVTTGNYTYTISDANGCSTTTPVTVGQPNSLSATATATAILCNGGTSTVTVAATGGTLPYTGTGNFTVNAGTHNYTVTDANGCNTTTSITITEPTLLTAVSINSPILCNGGSSVVTISANGGTLPYTGTGNITTNAGNYTYTITDANACTAITMGNISEPAPLAVTITGNPITCFNGNTLLTVNASGGVAPYTGTGNFTVNAGTYTYNVTDANGCAASANTSVSQPSALSASIINIKNVNCNGLGGSATVTAGGGSGNYLYSWVPGNYTQSSPSNIPAGNYTIYVKDAADPTCMTSATVTIGTAAPLSISGATITNLSCNAACDGSIAVTAAGASGAYSYAWSNGAGTAMAANLCAGNYTITVSDAQTSACSATATYTVVQPTALTISLQNQQNVLCNGGNSGAILVQANGGWGNYQYSWSNGQTGNNATNLTVGNYALIVTDSVCSQSQTFTITEPAAISLLSAQVTNATCSSANNGSIGVVATGGSGNYTYSWSGSSSTFPTITNLAAGTYSIFVTDAAASGCVLTQTFTVVDTFSLVATAQVLAQPSCNLADGMASVTVSGGSGNYNYVWSNGATTSSVSNLAAGTYSVSVSEITAPTCAVVANITLIESLPPSNISLNSNSNINLCEGESLLLTGSATNANSYIWLWNGTLVSASANYSATQAGVYQFVAYSGQGATGCATSSELVTITVTQKAKATLLIGGNSAICSGDSIPLIASGGLTYQWYEDGQLISGATNAVYWANQSGNYSVVAANTCNSDTSDAKQILVSLGVVANFTYEPMIAFEGQTVQFINQSANASTWSWAFGDNIGITLENPAHFYESAGQYPILLVAQDEYGCIDTLHASITILETDNPFIPNVITPNGDGIGDEFDINYMDLKETRLTILDRWGETVFETENQDVRWTGRNEKGYNCSEGVYFYVLEGKTALGKKTTHKGNVTLMR